MGEIYNRRLSQDAYTPQKTVYDTTHQLQLYTTREGEPATSTGTATASGAPSILGAHLRRPTFGVILAEFSPYGARYFFRPPIQTNGDVTLAKKGSSSLPSPHYIGNAVDNVSVVSHCIRRRHSRRIELSASTRRSWQLSTPFRSSRSYFSATGKCAFAAYHGRRPSPSV